MEAMGLQHLGCCHSLKMSLTSGLASSSGRWGDLWWAPGFAAVLAAGASGAWLGTAFAACPESLASDATRSALIEAKGTDTVVTRVFDIALGYPWPTKYPQRILRSEFWERLAGA